MGADAEKQTCECLAMAEVVAEFSGNTGYDALDEAEFFQGKGIGNWIKYCHT